MHLCCFGHLLLKNSCCVCSHFDFWFCSVAHSMRMSHRYFFILIPLFQYCMIDRYLQQVSTHEYIDLEIECCKFFDCICVVSVICFWKIYVVYVRILIFDFVLLHIVCGCLTYINFSSVSILYDDLVFAACKYAWICWTWDWV